MRRLALLPVGLALVAAGCGGGGSSDVTETPPGAAAGKGLKLVKIGRFDEPVYLTAPPEDEKRRFVVEQAGRIRVVRGRTVRTFLDIRGRVTSGSEQGLLSMAFSPDYATSRRFYVYYTGNDGDQRIVAFHAATENRADKGSARLVLKMADPESNHNGGLLLFGPDRRMYVGTGDGGGAGDRHGARGNGQNKDSLLGKILRINPARSGEHPYTIPADNPFVGGGGRPEIYSYGLRNPWRFSFDRATGDLVIGDVGQDAVEEIDYAKRDAGAGSGVNFGWRVFEGDDRYARGESAPGAVGPVMTFSHSAGNCSITGGVVVRDRSVSAAYGRYLFGDFCKGDILSAKLATPRTTAARTGLRVDSVSSFGEDARGRVYVISLNGPVYRLAAK
jgi:glucose/arabinose dehydrogenase